MAVGFSLSAASWAQAAALTLNEAQTVALSQAGLNRAEAEFVKAKSYRQGARQVHDLIFFHQGTKYQYLIAADSGEILSHHRVQTGRPARSGSDSGLSGGDRAGAYIGYEKARSLALAHARVDVTGLRKYEAELDRRNGRPVYEIEFKDGRSEYEYEIDAFSGEIVRWEAK